VVALGSQGCETIESCNVCVGECCGAYICDGALASGGQDGFIACVGFQPDFPHKQGDILLWGSVFLKTESNLFLYTNFRSDMPSQVSNKTKKIETKLNNPN
jgi:hypothetical protein